jgi:5-methylcytosine-specific restriction endonuclease McrA/predicted nucleic acid-binding Zn ribbon protein
MRFRSVQKTCLICGLPFTTYSGKRRTCSDKCRDELLRRDRPLCSSCGQRLRMCGRCYCLQCNRRKHLETYHKNKVCGDAKQLSPEQRHEKAIEKGCRYRAKHREILNVKQRRYYRLHYDIYVQHVEARRARIAGVPCTLTQSQWTIIKAVYGYRCAYCGKRAKILTKDHVIPLAKGGSHTADNIVPACRSCNSHKHIGDAPPFQRALIWHGEYPG